MSQNNRGKISPVSRPTDEYLAAWFPDNDKEKCWHFWEQPDKIGIGQGRLKAKDIGTSRFQYGRIFSKKHELRWEGDRFWLATDPATDGEFEIRDGQDHILLHGENQDKFKKIRCVYYMREGVVVHIRFKEASK